MIEKYNIDWVAQYEKGKYDLAILHLDQQCLEESLYDRGKGSLYRHLNEVIQDIPKVVIMHGTPYYPENFECDIFKCECGNVFAKTDYIKEEIKGDKIKYDNNGNMKCRKCSELGEHKQQFMEDQIGMSSELILMFKKILGDNYAVFNSHTARKQWGFDGDEKRRTIIHGLNPNEWWDLPKEPRVVTMISPAGLPKYYDRTFLAAVKEDLQERDIYHCHITVDAMFKNFDEYRNFLGRSLIYFNPTKESPMPRSRTEAMLSGNCVVTTPHQDADTFIRNGENGFIVRRNIKEACDLIEALIYDYSLAKKIGEAGRKTAIELFSEERYLQEWSDFIQKILK